jgi:hypothetical protein
LASNWYCTRPPIAQVAPGGSKLTLWPNPPDPMEQHLLVDTG